MNDFVLVVPYEPPLFKRLAGKRIVLEADLDISPDTIIQAAKRLNMDLRCVWLKSRRDLSDTRLDERWGDTPLALAVPAMGSMRGLVKQLRALRDANIRVYLPANTSEQCSDIRILSSLGLNCCAMIDCNEDSAVNWDSIRELAVYAIYNAMPHGDIDPFSFIVRQYTGCGIINFGSVYFDDPSRFLHVDHQGRLSLTRRDKQRGAFLAASLEDCESARCEECFIDRVNIWKLHFVEHGMCSECEGWRICSGAFSHCAGRGCAETFKEILEGAEHHRDMAASRTITWQL